MVKKVWMVASCRVLLSVYRFCLHVGLVAREWSLGLRRTYFTA
jgi:hypothetical protein